MVIGICDDDSTCRTQIRNVLESIEKRWEQIRIVEYSSGDEVLRRSKQESIPDILFLDVEMDGMNGLETAKMLRLENKDIIIIMVSSYQHYIFKSFHVNAFYFLVKPINEVELKVEFERAMKEYVGTHMKYEFSDNGALQKFLVKDIYYISGYYRHLNVFTENSSYIFDGSLNDIEQTFRIYGFVRVHQGFIVNMRYIKSIGEKKIILVNDKEVDISVRKRSEVKKMYNAFLLGGMR